MPGAAADSHAEAEGEAYGGGEAGARLRNISRYARGAVEGDRVCSCSLVAERVEECCAWITPQPWREVALAGASEAVLERGSKGQIVVLRDHGNVAAGGQRQW